MSNHQHPAFLALRGRNASFTVAMMGSVLRTAKKYKQLPGPFQSALRRIAAAQSALRAANTSRLVAPRRGSKQLAADRREDRAWRAFHDWLRAFTLIEEESVAGPARAIFDVLFADGLRFTQLPYQAEWEESEMRFGRIADGMVPAIVALGGKPLLDNLRQVHAAYGEAIGITADVAPTPSRAPMNPLRAAAMDALRDYAVVVVGHVDPEHPQTAQRAEALLAPLQGWNDGLRPTGRKPAASPPPAP